jgi:glycosyltransferase involved in cell wall biosynthesis
MDKACVYFTRFDPSVSMGGGARRLLQFLEVFGEIDFHVLSSLKPFHGPDSGIQAGGPLARLRAAVERRRISDWSDQRREAVLRLRRVSGDWARLVAESHRLRLAVVDDPIYFPSLVRALHKRRIPAVAMCHNLEALSPHLVRKGRQRGLLDKEIGSLAGCDLVITISREETALLRSLDVNAVYFPYYPIREVLNRMLNVRSQRLKTTKKDILLLGTALNAETRTAMLQVINAWKRQNGGAHDHRLLVAGYHTERLRDEAGTDHGIDMLGSLTDDELDRRLSSVKACLCYQSSGGGALTRICEMLIAGVPVLANAHAARSYYNVKGIVELPALDGLGDAITQIESVEGCIPVPSRPEVSSLAGRLKGLLEHEVQDYSPR